MNELTPLEAAWVAALIEGEGCIHLFPTTATISINMTDFDIIQRLARLSGCGHYQTKSYAIPRYKPQLRWNLTRKQDVFDFLRMIRPWLGIRRGDMADAAMMTILTHPMRWDADPFIRLTQKKAREARWRANNPEKHRAFVARTNKARTERRRLQRARERALATS